MTEPVRAPEIRCLRCNTSFAPETRNCAHCGAQLRGIVVRRRVRGPGEPAREETQEPRQVLGQAAVAILSVGIMMLMAFARACE